MKIKGPIIGLSTLKQKTPCYSFQEEWYTMQALSFLNHFPFSLFFLMEMRLPRLFIQDCGNCWSKVPEVVVSFLSFFFSTFLPFPTSFIIKLMMTLSYGSLTAHKTSFIGIFPDFISKLHRQKICDNIIINKSKIIVLWLDKTEL